MSASAGGKKAKAIIALRLLAILLVPTLLMLLLCVLLRVNPLATAILCGVTLLGNLSFAFLIPVMSMHALRSEPHSEPSPELKAAIARLAAKAGIEPPPCVILHDDELNACTVGYGKEHLMALNNGLLRNLSAEEVEAVVLHEYGHIKNRDASLNAVSSGIIRVFGLIAMVIAGLFALVVFILMLLSKNHSSWFLGDLAIRAGFWLSAVVFPFLLLLPQMASSRSREFKADVFSAEVQGRPDHLISALQKIRDAPHPKAGRGSAKGVDQLFWFSRPGATSSMAEDMLASHPSIEKRIERLRHLPVAKESIGPSPGPYQSYSGTGIGSRSSYVQNDQNMASFYAAGQELKYLASKGITVHHRCVCGRSFPLAFDASGSHNAYCPYCRRVLDQGRVLDDCKRAEEALRAHGRRAGR